MARSRAVPPCTGAARILVDGVGIGEFDEFAGIQDGDAVGDVADDGQIVGDEE